MASHFRWSVFLALDHVAFTTLRDAIIYYRDADPKPKFTSENDMYHGVPVWVGRVFWRIYNNDYYERVAKTPTIGGKVWHLYLLYFPEGSTSFARAWLERLEARYPNRVVIVAAYNYRTGLLAGQRYNDNDVVVGTPAYPVHNRAHEFMPDDVTYDEFGNPTYTPATEFRRLWKLAGEVIL